MNPPVSGASGDFPEPATTTNLRLASWWPLYMLTHSAVCLVDNFDPRPPPALVCRLCQGVLRDPVECACAYRNVFCSSCITHLIADAPTICATCYTKMTTSLLVPVVAIVVDMIAKQKVRC
ncbi:hypothetical protein HPB51_020108 [Rhipicephalus microplus]|uniref:RING-type domain-containing protein n=1 Tax=Rhipicephalus microplus TaxID=6941 RepID=A0A9J6EI48_RHIMP|nr:hypothetical protein HPB51_020108 [Rhipicephalus microplus]